MVSLVAWVASASSVAGSFHPSMSCGSDRDRVVVAGRQVIDRVDAASRRQRAFQRPRRRTVARPPPRIDGKHEYDRGRACGAFSSVTRAGHLGRPIGVGHDQGRRVRLQVERAVRDVLAAQRDGLHEPPASTRNGRAMNWPPAATVENVGVAPRVTSAKNCPGSPKGVSNRIAGDPRRRSACLAAVLDPSCDAKRGPKRDDEIQEIIGADGDGLGDPVRGLALLNRPGEERLAVGEDVLAGRHAEQREPAARVAHAGDGFEADVVRDR